MLKTSAPSIHILDSICCFSYIDDHQEEYVKRLAEVVAIPSVSAWPERRDDVIRQVKHTAKVLLIHRVI